MKNDLLFYDIAPGVTAFSTLRDARLPFDVVQSHQVHGDRVAVIRTGHETREDLEGIDALITDVPGVALGARTADCVPVLLYDPACRAIASVHAGWKGTVLKITHRVIESMGIEFGSRADEILALIGPSIGPRSFQVGSDVVSRFVGAGFPMDEILLDMGPAVKGAMDTGVHIDLWRANGWTLQEAGVKPSNIAICGIDSYADGRFFSARREGTTCGRIINVIRLDG